MPTSTTKIDSKINETRRFGPILIRSWDIKQYVTVNGTSPSLTNPGTKAETWVLEPIPNDYRRFRIYESPADPKHPNEYHVVNKTANNTLSVDWVDSLDKATVWTVEETTLPNVYRISIALSKDGPTLRWTRQDGSQNLLLQKLGTDVEKASFAFEETFL